MFLERRVVAASILLAGVAPPAIAQGKSSAPLDPNEKVCESVKTVGSRLATKRVCATRAEWVERRKSERAAAVDMQRVIGGNRCSIDDPVKGTPSC